MSSTVTKRISVCLAAVDISQLEKLMHELGETQSSIIKRALTHYFMETFTKKRGNYHDGVHNN
jgi:hypothetical protein